MNDTDVLSKLSALGLSLPAPPQALAAYVPVRIGEGIAHVSGQVPMLDGTLLHPGALGREVTVEQGAEAAARAALQLISALRDALGGSLERLDQLLTVSVFVASVPDFFEHPKVANGASELLAELLGEAGRHARIAVGVASLPLGSCVEVAGTAAVRA